jgi:CheY-like chemotaxis protein
METTPIRILLVEDNPGDARLIQEMLAETENSSFKIDRNKSCIGFAPTWYAQRKVCYRTRTTP